MFKLYIYIMYNNFVDNTENINEIDMNKNKKLFDLYQ